MIWFILGLLCGHYIIDDIQLFLHNRRINQSAEVLTNDDERI